MIKQYFMISMHNSIYNQNTIIRSSPMTPKSPRRSTNRRIHNFSSYSTKIRQLWNNTNCHFTRPTNQKYSLPIYPSITLRYNHNKFYLSTPNRPKITNRILFSKSHSPSHRINHNPNSLKLYRSYNTDNCPRPNFITIILSSKL